MKVYLYKLIREDEDGNRGKRTKTIYRYENTLKVGGLYAHLGPGCPGLQRVLSVTEKEYPDIPDA